MLNISPANIIYTVINLLLLFFVCKKFLFGPVDRILEERKKEIEEATAGAEKATEAAELKAVEYEGKLARIDQEREKLIAETKEKSLAEYDTVLENARKEADQIVADARKAAEIEAQRAREQQATELEELVLDAAQKISLSKHDDDADRKLYDEFIRKGASSLGE